jgi:hypothetical protein
MHIHFIYFIYDIICMANSLCTTTSMQWHRVYKSLLSDAPVDAKAFKLAAQNLQSQVMSAPYEQAATTLVDLGKKHKVVKDWFAFWERVAPHFARHGSDGQAVTDSPSKSATNLAEAVHSSMDATCRGSWSRRRPAPTSLIENITTLYSRELVAAGRAANAAVGILPRTTQNQAGREALFDSRQLRDADNLVTNPSNMPNAWTSNQSLQGASAGGVGVGMSGGLGASVQATDSHRHDRRKRDSGATSATTTSPAGAFSAARIGSSSTPTRKWNGNSIRKRSSASASAKQLIASSWQDKATFYIVDVLSFSTTSVKLVVVQTRLSHGQLEATKQTLELSASPSCSCPEFVRTMVKGIPQHFCTHIMCVLMKYCQVLVTDALLWTPAFTSAEVMVLITAMQPASLVADAPLTLDFTAPMRRPASLPGAGVGAAAGHMYGAGAAGVVPGPVGLPCDGWMLEKKSSSSQAECSTRHAKPTNHCGRRTPPARKGGNLLVKGSFRLVAKGQYTGSGGRGRDRIDVENQFFFCADARCVTPEILASLAPTRRVPPLTMPVRLAPGTVPTITETAELLTLGVTFV